MRLLVRFTPNGEIALTEIDVPVKPLEIAFRQADREVEKVHQSAEVVRFFKEMDDAVQTIESTDPREIMRQLCPVDEPELYNLAVELCAL